MRSTGLIEGDRWVEKRDRYMICGKWMNEYSTNMGMRKKSKHSKRIRGWGLHKGYITKDINKQMRENTQKTLWDRYKWSTGLREIDG